MSFKGVDLILVLPGHAGLPGERFAERHLHHVFCLADVRRSEREGKRLPVAPVRVYVASAAWPDTTLASALSTM